jgi:hypothetical protein
MKSINRNEIRLTSYLHLRNTNRKTATTAVRTNKCVFRSESVFQFLHHLPRSGKVRPWLCFFVTSNLGTLDNAGKCLSRFKSLLSYHNASKHVGKQWLGTDNNIWKTNKTIGFSNLLDCNIPRCNENKSLAISSIHVYVGIESNTTCYSFSSGVYYILSDMFRPFYNGHLQASILGGVSCDTITQFSAQ